MHWALTIEIFIDYRIKGIIEGPQRSIHMAIDTERQLIGKPWMQAFFRQELTEIMPSLMAWTLPTLLAISFMHCKNVTVIDESVPKPLAKKYYARTGQWPMRYKTLEIRPLQARQNATRLARNPDIRERLEELSDHVAQQS
jgi:hypothetical protein